MEKRVLLAIFLCFLSLYVWQALGVKPIPKASATSTAPAAPSGANAAPQAPPSSASPAREAEAAPVPAPTVVTGETQEKTIRLETRDVIAQFTNRGARLKSWRLKHYLDQAGQPQELVVDLPSQPLPLTLRTADAAANTTMAGALYAVQGGDGAAAEGSSAPLELKFEYLNDAGLHVTKQFRLEPAGYVLSVQADVRRGGQALPFS